MDRFVNDELNRLRKLANVSTTEDERKILFGLLADEKTKFIGLQKGRIPDALTLHDIPEPDSLGG